MRGETIYKILDFIEDSSLSAVDLTTAILQAGYGASMSKIEYGNKILSKERESYRYDRQEGRHLQVYLSKLKSDGLILENFSNKLQLSKNGKHKLKLLKRNKIIDKNSFKKEIGNRTIIISYDIPISFNKERNILRNILRVLGFRLIHKSVWIGKVKISQQFIDALSTLGILKFVEILEVTKNGSLKEI